MKNYDDMSDSDINKLVAEKMGYCKIEEGIGSEVYVGFSGLESTEKFSDYCNNPADAWPIICSYKINIEFVNEDLDGEDDLCTASRVIRAYGDSCRSWVTQSSYTGSRPLRAAMILFLMISEDGKQ